MESEESVRIEKLNESQLLRKLPKGNDEVMQIQEGKVTGEDETVCKRKE